LSSPVLDFALKAKENDGTFSEHTNTMTPLPAWFLRVRGSLRENGRTAAFCFLCLAILAIFLLFPVLHASEHPISARRARLMQGIDRPKHNYAPGEILVRFRAGTPEPLKLQAHALVSAQVLKRFTSVGNLEKIRLPEGTSIDAAIKQYRTMASVEYAEPNYIVRALQSPIVPNDPYFNQQWSLRNTGQTGGTSGADIQAPQAWSITKGSSNVVVAVIDSGVDYTHPDLASQIWRSPSAYSVTRSQGDVFTCPAGAHGFDAVNGTCTPMDDLGHGTHVSGTIGAATNNSAGVAGIAWNVQIVACKFLNSQGFGDTSGAITCLDMVKSLKDSGVNIVASNNSWGGEAFSQALSDAIEANAQSGILFIAAAGNDFQDTDLVPTYPADIVLPNIISVAASDATDQYAAFSNIGRRTTHIAAPGDHILSTTPNNTYSVFSGTSMATPHVSGVIALLKAQDSNRDWRALKNLVLAGGDTVAALDSTISGKRLNAFGSLTCSNKTVQSRLLPVANTIAATQGTPVTLAALSINCAAAAGPVAVTVSPGGQTVTLSDGGTNGDQAAGDGIFTGQWTPPGTGNYTLTFPWGDTLQAEVLSAYNFKSVSNSYTTIAGSNLNLGDDGIAQVASPFPIPYGAGSFSNLNISSNGTISFTETYDDYVNAQMPPVRDPPFTLPLPTTLISPWWQDLFPVKGTAQNVFWSVLGSAPNRQLVVEWRDVRGFLCSTDTTATVKFEVVFFEGKSDVQFNYADTAFGGSCASQDHGGAATVGLQQSLTQAQMFSFDEQTLSDGTSLLWTIAAPASNPVPVANSVSPTTALRGASGATITVNGSNFVLGSRIQFNGRDHSTTFVSGSILTTQLTSEDLGVFFQSAATVQVFTPGPGGGTSQSLPFTILNPAPVIASLTPTSVNAGGLTFNLTVNGSGFVFGSSFIFWNGQQLPISFVLDDNTIAAQVSYGMISLQGTARITVFTGGPGGGTSNSSTLTIAPQSGIGFLPAGAMTQAQAIAAATAQAMPLYLDASGKPRNPATPPTPGKPLRFMGWNYGAKMGPAYLKHFARPHAGMAGLMPKPNSVASGTQTKKTMAATAQSFLNGTASLAGFAIRPTLPADYLPTSIATGDFNHDGKTDWVVSNGGTNSLWIYLGKGDATSQLPVILPLTGSAPLQVVTADLRNIGIMDLIVAEADSGTVGILLGNGDGTFQKEIELYGPGPVLSVAAADFNGDGKLDIVAGLAGSAATGPLVFFKGDGKGGFGPAIFRPSESGVGSYATVTIQTADLNKDGLPDLVINDEGGVVNGAHAYLSAGDGTFKESQYFFEAGPFVNPLNAAAADFDGDGCPDVAVSTDAGSVYLFHGNCDGTVGEFPSVELYGAGEAGAGLGIADVNGDGHLDVVISGITFDVGPYGPPTGDSVSVLLGDGHGHLSPGKIFRGEPGMFSLAIADLNGDGKPEILTSNQDTDSVSIYVNDGSGGFGGASGAYVGYATDGVTGGAINAPFGGPIVKDVNGDGKPDILFIEYPMPGIVDAWVLTTLLNDGTGHFGKPLHSAVMDGTMIIYDLQLVDVRGTGKPDMVLLGGNNDVGIGTYIGFAANLGDGTFGPLRLTPFSGSPWIFDTGDFDGDGKLDLVVLGNTGQSTGFTDRITFMKGNGDGTFTPGANTDFGPAGSTGGSPRMSFVADFNGDHKLDLIITVNDQVIGPGSLNHSAYEFFGNGDGTFKPPVVIIPDVYSLTMADVNHDGHPDLIEWVAPFTIAGFGPPTYKVHLGRPDGSFVDGQTYSPFGGIVSAITSTGPSILRFNGPLLADANGDGNLDILVPQRYNGWDGTTGGPVFTQGYLQVLLGNGDGTFTPDHHIFNLSKIFPPDTAADINGDGKADLVEIDPWPSSYNVIPALGPTTIQVGLLTDPVINGKGTLRLNLGVPNSSATTVTITASDPNITVSQITSVPAGNVTQDVSFTIGSGFNPLHVFSLRAQLGSASATAYGTVARPGAGSGFQLSLINNSESTGPGGTTSDYVLGIASINGYVTTVQIQCQGLPTGATCQFAHDPASVLAGTFVNDSVTIAVAQNVPRGSYPFTIVATDGAITTQISATLGVSDFSISVTPSTLVAYPGLGASYNMTITALNGWSQSIVINCPVVPSGPKCSFDGSAFLPGNYPLSIDPQNAPPGNYSINVTGTALGVSHGTSVALKIEDASIGLSKVADTVSVGNSTSINVSMNSLNSFTDQFAFSCPSLPTGLSCTFNPSSGTLPAGGTLTSALTLKVISRPAVGMFVPEAPSAPALTQQPKPTWPSIYVLCSVLLLFAAFVLASGSSRSALRRGWARPIPAFSLLLILFVASCGGGSGTSSTGTNPPPPPPPPPPSAVVVHFQVQAVSPTLTRTSETVTITVP
jgi:hypothetical protein